ncbi:hypothetical protein [Caldimonas sp. KR1-144]|uniref:hypothetical protein n=1 Tax=Caldimonas sp. KR1-144 TaxID=3400911 RepID=UPI003BFD76EE
MSVKIHALLLPALFAGATLAHAGPVEDAVSELQRSWEVIRYQTPSREREKRYEQLAARAHQLSQSLPGRSEPMVWEAIIVSSWAGEAGGFGALAKAKQAKALYESAIAIDPRALDGSAYNSLGVLYYKVPGWPIGFGDKAKAEANLKKALEINPNGIDPNFFYGEFLVEQKRAAEALPYLEKALAAPSRPDRQIADAGRREEARELLEKARTAAAH